MIDAKDLMKWIDQGNETDGAVILAVMKRENNNYFPSFLEDLAELKDYEITYNAENVLLIKL